jgi:hypothetical protein
LPRQTLANLFPLTLLALKFSQWWYSPNSPRHSHIEETGGKDRVKVPPPRMIRPAEKGWTSLNEKRKGGRDTGVNENSESDQDDDEGRENQLQEKAEKSSLSTWDDDSVSSSSSELSVSKTSPQSITGSIAPDERQTPAYGHCPICEEPWTNPTTLPTGYVGCYLCLYRFVEKREVCPVTGIDLRKMGGVESLRKVLI